MSFPSSHHFFFPLVQPVVPTKRATVQQPFTQRLFETSAKPKSFQETDFFHPLHFGMHKLTKKASKIFKSLSGESYSLIPKTAEEIEEGKLKDKYKDKMSKYFSILQKKWDSDSALGDLNSKIQDVKIVYSDKRDEAIQNIKQILKTGNDKHFGAVLVIPKKSPQKEIFNLPAQSQTCTEDDLFKTTTAVFRAGTKDKKLLYIITDDKKAGEKLKKAANSQFDPGSQIFSQLL
jgi:hypothetical protein